MSSDKFINEFIKTRDEMAKLRRAKEERLGITSYQIKGIKDYANFILTKANYIEFTQIAVEDNILSYENARKIIEFQRKEIEQAIENMKPYIKVEGKMEGYDNE